MNNLIFLYKKIDRKLDIFFNFTDDILMLKLIYVKIYIKIHE